MPDLAISYVPLADLAPYPKNARTHSPEQIDQIAASIGEYGWTNPILVDERNSIIAGHGRAQAAAKLEMAQVPAIRLEGLTAAQKRALRLADNKLALNAGWSDELLRAELIDLKFEGFDLGMTGFMEIEIDQLFAPDTDPEAEWRGMPEYAHTDQTAFQSIVMHFRNADDVARFGALIEQVVTPKTRFAWFPPDEIGHYADKRYTDEPAISDPYPVEG